MDVTPKRTRAPGGGRKPLDGQGTQRVTVTLRPSDLAYLRSLDANMSHAIRTLIDRATQHPDPATDPILRRVPAGFWKERSGEE